MMTAPDDPLRGYPAPDTVLRLCAAAGDPASPGAPWVPSQYALVAGQVLLFIVGLALVLQQQASVATYLKDGRFGQPPQSPLQSLVLFRPAVELLGQWWRLLSYALVHFGALHLLMNQYGHAVL